VISVHKELKNETQIDERKLTGFPLPLEQGVNE
jgi:hypothetical protein